VGRKRSFEPGPEVGWVQNWLACMTYLHVDFNEIESKVDPEGFI
jgi:hypothetical protein